MADIVVVGSLNMDLVAKVKRLPSHGETVIAHHFQVVPGGKGANQAVAVGRLGATAGMVGRVGMDSYGEILLSSLTTNGVDVSYVTKDSDLPTGTALITVDDNGENTITVFPGANGRCLPEDVKAAESFILKAKALIAQLEIPLETVQTALRVAKENAIMTVFNPAPFRRLPEDLLSIVDYLILNEVEASALCGCPVDQPHTAIEVGKRILDMGPGRVVLTLGEKGAVFAGPEGGFHVPAFRVKAIDSTAAGDAFIGAFTVALVEGMDVEEGLRYGCASGAIATTRMGAQTSLPTRDEIKELLGFSKLRRFQSYDLEGLA